MGKPSEADARILGSLFPSASAPKRTYSKAFSPLDGCVVSREKQQKKATRMKPRKVTVVFLTDHKCKKVPRGPKRKALTNDGFIKQIELLRNMPASKVRAIISKAFAEKTCGKARFSFLTADPKLHVLTKVEEKEGGADGADLIEIAGQGSLYVRLMVCLVCYIVLYRVYFSLAL